MIRRMEEADLSAVAGIESRCFSDSWSFALIGKGVAAGPERFWVAEEDGIILGYADLCVIAGEGEIRRIAVLPEFRERGYGKKLMDAMVTFSRENGITSVTLEVRSGNWAARNLYRSYGFKEEAIRKGYYRNPEEDAIILWNRSI